MLKITMTWAEFAEACEMIGNRIRKGYCLTKVYGIPRGGLPLAVVLSHLLGLELITDVKKITDLTLIVDDIADTGETLYPFRGHVTATLYYHRQSKVEPIVWIYEKTDKWIEFPWE